MKAEWQTHAKVTGPLKSQVVVKTQRNEVAEQLPGG